MGHDDARLTVLKKTVRTRPLRHRILSFRLGNSEGRPSCELGGG